MAPVAATEEQSGDLSLSASDNAFEKKNAMFRVYPNPTAGIFTLELTRHDTQPMQEFIMEIYDIRGEKIMSEKIRANQSYVFSLEDRQPGIYVIRVVGKNQLEVEKIIKK